MRNYNDICVFDFETGGLDTQKCEILQVAAVIIDSRTLQVKTEHTFKSYMKPIDFNNLDEKALEVNGITKEQLQDAPDRKVVWANFVTFINRFNKKAKFYTAPIPAGSNIKNFDLPIIDRLCNEYGTKDLFFRKHQIDVIDLVFPCFEGRNDGPANSKLGTLCEYFGIPTEGLHDALNDVIATAKIIARFLQYYRNISAKTVFKDAFKTK